MSDKDQLHLDELFARALAAAESPAKPPFEEQLARFVTFAQKVIDDYMAKEAPRNLRKVLETSKGARYIRIASVERSDNNINSPPISRSAWAFVDSTNGDILKPAGWKTPAKHARGNIYDQANWKKWIGPYGPAYLK